MKEKFQLSAIKSIRLAAFLVLICTGILSSCKEGQIDITTTLVQPEIVTIRTFSVDTMYMLGGTYSISFPVPETMRIQFTGDYEWLDNNGGTVWNAVGGGPIIDVKCPCLGGNSDWGDECSITNSLSAGKLKIRCSQGTCSGECRMDIKINGTVSVSNGITIRPIF